MPRSSERGNSTQPVHPDGLPRRLTLYANFSQCSVYALFRLVSETAGAHCFFLFFEHSSWTRVRAGVWARCGRLAGPFIRVHCHVLPRVADVTRVRVFRVSIPGPECNLRCCIVIREAIPACLLPWPPSMKTTRAEGHAGPQIPLRGLFYIYT